MDPETVRLCAWIIKSHFGDMVSLVVQTLAAHGRLSFRELVLFTKLKPRAIAASLIVLSQHGLLWHSNVQDDERYECNVDECLQRQRFGKFLLIANDLYGEYGVLVVQTILDHGRVRFPQLIEELPQIERGRLQKLVRRMLQKRFIKSTTEYLTKSRADRIADAENRLLMADVTTKNVAVASAKRLAEKRLEAEEQVAAREREVEALGLKLSESKATTKSMKGKDKDKEKEIDETIWLRINFTTFNICLRNSLIESAVRARYNEPAASVMRAVLKATEKSQLSLHDAKSDIVGSNGILEEMSEDDNLASGLATRGSSKSNASLLKEYISMLSTSDTLSPSSVSSSFLSSGSTGMSSKVQVDFIGIYRKLKLAVLEGYVRERWGPLAVRIVKILLAMGMMDERQLAKVAMISPDSIRPLISVLSGASIITSQEVPKGKDFLPSRTSYFWHVDMNKTNAVMLSTLMKTMANIMERKAAESSTPLLKTLLETRRRTDVAADESLLTYAEKELLRQWEEKMVKLGILESRVDEAMFILRELPLAS